MLTTKGLIDDATCDCHELPALVAHVGATATGAHLIVVGHVNIEDQLALYGSYGGGGSVIFRPVVEERADC